jgi:alpha-glucosidase (family GH31 glycosyl hydrolase)
LELTIANGIVRAHPISQNVIRIDYLPLGKSHHPTEMMDPHGSREHSYQVSIEDNQFLTSALAVDLKGNVLRVTSPDDKTKLEVDLAQLAQGSLKINHDPGEHLYGMRGIGLGRPKLPSLSVAAGIVRDEGAPVAAGAQGDGGAPLAYSATWGVLVDSIDGKFSNADGVLEFDGTSKDGVEAYIVLGPPKAVIEAATDLTGHPPMPPKWAVGFMNSQWGTTEDEVLSIVDKYREKQIPLDAFILDFDFKAWGEDNFGEWRWNSTSGPGSVSPNKYPNGQNGKFGQEMLRKGVHVLGIMKPRILTQNSELKPTRAAAEATEHNWWMPGKKPYQDYFSHRLANDLDFSQPSLRKWFWKHAEPLYQTGISGWWNDEADEGFDSLGFMHMQQSLFEGQESASNKRVWSLNRNFYLGAQRFAFGTWSGDIRTGFQTMADQRARMLTTVDLGQPHWSMDSGGFGGHPTPESYARWIEFAAMVPIMRVHNTYGEHRQPWVYGPVAEAAAAKAIRLRYSLFPYLYSAEHSAHETGVGIVRPLFWEFPNDPACANAVDSWMVGDSLLVAPVVQEGQKSLSVYLPEGTWYGYFDDASYTGGKAVTINCDSENWSDIPIFVRAGSIIASQPVLNYALEKPVDELTLDIWPSDKEARFEVYDDDGETRANERGRYFSQVVRCVQGATGPVVYFDRPSGSYHSSIKTYRVRLHLSAGIQMQVVLAGERNEAHFGTPEAAGR